MGILGVWRATYLVKRQAILVVGVEASESSEFLPVLRILDSAQLQHRSEILLESLELGRLFVCQSVEDADEVLDDDLLDLLQEASGLKCFAGDVQGEVLRCRRTEE